MAEGNDCHDRADSVSAAFTVYLNRLASADRPVFLNDLRVFCARLSIPFSVKL